MPVPSLFALPEAARLLGGVSVWTLRKHVAAGRLRVTRLGTRVFLDAEEIDRVRREGLPSLRGSLTVRDHEALGGRPAEASAHADGSR
jgi:excisionase family DNA binding protein